MGYRLDKRELEIIEQTKSEGERTAGEAGQKNDIWAMLKPYLFFAALFLAIALAWLIFLIFTG